MSPRPQTTPTLEDHVSSHASDEDEERPTHTSEIGTLKKLPNQGTAWLGSSSGVYFANTVRRAFSAAFAASQALPASEDILTGEDADGKDFNGPVAGSSADALPNLLSTSLGRLPERKIAIELVMTFFKSWHPIFPFLHGPSFLKDMEILYQNQKPAPPPPFPSTKRQNSSQGSQRSSSKRHNSTSGGQATQRSKRKDSTSEPPNPPRLKQQNGTNGVHAHHELRKLITFQLIINIASLDRPDIDLPAESRIRSTADVTQIAGCIALDHDLPTIQTLLAAQLYLVAMLAIRAASTVGGIIVKLIYHAGLHRCPLRYAQLSIADCEIRKRIFWAAYALDRHCSLSLGDPNTIQDDDIDVCLSGKELHKAVARELLTHPEQEISLHRTTATQRVGGLASGPVQDDPRLDTTTPETREKELREAALISYVHWSRLTGRIIEIFHKSINHRFPKNEQIVYLTSDIETWWNDLPSFLSGEDPPPPPDLDARAGQPSPGSSDSSPQYQLAHLSSFFKILYHRLLLLISRPRLSLDQSTPEFQHGLQICIRASRNILAGLKAHKQQGQSMFLPGLLSAAWMSGLIIAFACQLGKYPKARACADIQACLYLLSAMNLRWYTVKNCHKVLSLLLSNINSRRASTNGLLAFAKSDQPSPQSHIVDIPDRATKRQRRDTQTKPVVDTAREQDTASPVLTEGTPNSNISSPSITNPTLSLATGLPRTGSIHKAPSVWSNSSVDASANPASVYDLSAFIHTTQTPPSGSSNANPAGSNTTPTSNKTRSSNHGLSTSGLPALGSAVYKTPQDLAQAQSTMALPELPPLPGNSLFSTNGTPGDGLQDPDPMFWGNMDYNLADVFGSVTWETMTSNAMGFGMGGTGPHSGNGGWDTGGGFGGGGPG